MNESERSYMKGSWEKRRDQPFRWRVLARNGGEPQIERGVKFNGKLKLPVKETRGTNINPKGGIPENILALPSLQGSDPEVKKKGAKKN